MKTVFSLLLLLVSLCSLAQKRENTAYVDISGDKDDDTYYIVFAAQGQERQNKLDMKDIPGHSWIVFAKEDAATKRSQVHVYGYWPDKLLVEQKNPKHAFSETIAYAGRRPFFIPNLIAECAAQKMGLEMRAYFEITRTIILWDYVPGMIKDELEKAMKYKAVAMAVFKVNKGQYDTAMTIAECYKDTPPDYHLFYTDCVRFQIDVAKSIGIYTPKRKLLKWHTWLPVDYMKLFVKKLPYENIQQLKECRISQKDNGDHFITPVLSSK